MSIGFYQASPLNYKYVVVNQPESIISVGTTVFVSVICLLYCFFSIYPAHAAFCFCILFVIVRLLWRPNRPAVILYWFLYQWFQIFSSVLFSDFLGLKMNRWVSNDMGEYTLFLSLIGLSVQLLVISLLTNSRSFQVTFEKLKTESERINVIRVVYLYGAFAILYPILFTLALSFPPLRQAILVFAQLKASFLVLLVFLLFVRKTHKSLIVGVLIFEFISGFLTYFSSFKEVFIFALLTYLSLIKSLKLSALLKIIPVILVLFSLLVFWSASKEEYRQFVNQGNRVQQVQVSSKDAFTKLTDLYERFDVKSFNYGLTLMLYRIQYVYFFSKVVDRIPKYTSYEDGKVWGNAARFALVPRALDPNKGIHDASAKTNKYAGVNVSGISKGVSISLGYYADAYIDFGPVGMMIPIAFIAFLLAMLYRMIMNFKLNIIFRYSIIIAVLSNIGYFESDSTFILGMLKNHIIFQAIFSFLLYPHFNKYISNNKA